MRKSDYLLPAGCSLLFSAVVYAAELPLGAGVPSVYEAAESGNMQALRAIVEDKADTNAPDEQGRTPLDIAVAAGHAEAVAFLIANGASPTMRTMSLVTTPEVLEVLQAALDARNLELQLSEAVASGNLPEARRLLAQGVSANALTPDNQMSVLMQAVKARRIWMVRVLLENGADPNYVNPQSKSVLHIAATDAGGPIVRRLLAAGANPMAAGSNRVTPLHDAVWANNADTVRALLPAYRAQNFNPDGMNGLPLIMAITKGNRSMVRDFIAAGTDLRGECFNENPPLAVAVKAGRVHIARDLLRAGADPDAKDSEGRSARDYAAMNGMNLFD